MSNYYVLLPNQMVDLESQGIAMRTSILVQFLGKPTSGAKGLLVLQGGTGVALVFDGQFWMEQN